MGIEILNPEWKKRKKRQVTALLLSAVAIQTVGAQKFDTNIAGSVVSALADSNESSPSSAGYSYNGEVQAANKFWKLNPNYASVIDGLQIEQHKKDYLKFVAEGVGQVINAGYSVNPQGMFIKAPFETSYGTDSIAQNANNHFGMKGGCYGTATTEFINGEFVGITDEFKCYDRSNPYGSFFDYAESLTNPNRRNDIYWDTIDCGGLQDIEMYVEGLLHRKSRDDCSIEAWQNQVDPVTGGLTESYATDPNYMGKMMNMAEFLKADEIFIPETS